MKLVLILPISVLVLLPMQVAGTAHDVRWSTHWSGCDDSQGDSVVTAEGFEEGVELQGTETEPGQVCPAGDGNDDDPYEYRERRSICGSDTAQNFCAYVECANPNEVGYYVQRRLEGTNNRWRSAGHTCRGSDGPDVTPGRVLQAIRRIGLPDAKLRTQPGFKSGKTLVNFDTNFFTKVRSVTETLTVLGERVTVEAVPTSYTWHFDSGRPDQTRTTSTPGAPYPNLSVTYAYEDAHVTVHPSVDVTYEARFSVGGGTWQAIPETITIEGDPVTRYVAEATPMLTGVD